jgi:hypothetical protein
VVPVFVADAKQDSKNSEVSFVPFDQKELDPSKFPVAPHARSRDTRHIITDFRFLISHFSIPVLIFLLL